MPRYYLNIRRDGVLIADPDGEEAQDLSAIQVIARDTIVEILRRPETYGDVGRWRDCAIEISDQAGTTVATVAFSENG